MAMHITAAEANQVLETLVQAQVAAFDARAAESNGDTQRSDSRIREQDA